MFEQDLMQTASRLCASWCEGLMRHGILSRILPRTSSSDDNAIFELPPAFSELASRQPPSTVECRPVRLRPRQLGLYWRGEPLMALIAGLCTASMFQATRDCFRSYSLVI